MFTKWKLPSCHENFCRSWLLDSSPTLSLLLFLPLQILGEANAKIDGVRHVGGIACEGKSGKEPEEIAWESFLTTAQVKHLWKESKKKRGLCAKSLSAVLGKSWSGQASGESRAGAQLACWRSLHRAGMTCLCSVIDRGYLGSSVGPCETIMELQVHKMERLVSYTHIKVSLKGELLGEPPWHRTCDFTLYPSASRNLFFYHAISQFSICSHFLFCLIASSCSWLCLSNCLFTLEIFAEEQ